METISEVKNIEEFKKLSETNGVWVVKFYADWCASCKLMDPIFDKLAAMEQFQDLNFIHINRDFNADLVREYNFDFPTIPRFFVVEFYQGQVNILEDMGGSQSKSSLEKKIMSWKEKLAEKHTLNLELKDQLEQKTDDTQSKASKEPKIAIIGSGPAGLTAGIYSSRANLDTTIFLGTQPGGQLTTTTEIENFPGAWDFQTKEGVMGPKLMNTMMEQARHFGSKTKFEVVSKIEKIGPKFELDYGQGKDTFDAVIIATGASARYLGISGEEKYVGKGYHSCATCDGFFYKGQEVIIVGGGDTAMEEATFLSKFATKVYIVHRHDKFKASKTMLERARKDPKIEFLLFKQIVDFIPDENKSKVVGVKLKDTQTEEVSDFAISAVFVAIGHIPNSDFVENLSLDKDSVGYLVPQGKVNPEFRVSKYPSATQIPGVFLAGDIEDSNYRQAITAAGDGCRAAMDMERWLGEMEE